MPRVSLDPSERAERRLCDWIRGELSRQKLKQSDLATELGVSQVAVSKMLRGIIPWKYRDVVRAVMFLNGDVTEVIGK